MKPIKLDDMACTGRINGMGARDPEGSYVEIVCTEDGDAGDQPQTLAFSISEGQADVLIAQIRSALLQAQR